MTLETMLLVAPVAGVLALVYAFIKTTSINKADMGTDKERHLRFPAGIDQELREEIWNDAGFWPY